MASGTAGTTDIAVRIDGDDVPGELRSLSGWLGAEDRLRGRVRLASAPPGPGSMGAGTESLLVALGPGGMATAFAAIVVAWIRSRTGAVSVELSRKDGTCLRLTAKNARSMTNDQVREMTGRLAELLPAPGEEPGGDPAR